MNKSGHDLVEGAYTSVIFSLWVCRLNGCPCKCSLACEVELEVKDIPCEACSGLSAMKDKWLGKHLGLTW